MTHPYSYTRTTRSSTWIPCALCGYDDTEAPPNGWGYGDDLPEGTAVPCCNCGATLTLVGYDADYEGEETGFVGYWSWEATPPPSLRACVRAAVAQVPGVIAQLNERRT